MGGRARACGSSGANQSRGTDDIKSMPNQPFTYRRAIGSGSKTMAF